MHLNELRRMMLKDVYLCGGVENWWGWVSDECGIMTWKCAVQSLKNNAHKWKNCPYMYVSLSVHVCISKKCEKKNKYTRVGIF